MSSSSSSGSNKDYYLLRNHNGTIENVKVNVVANKDASGKITSYTFSFVTGKFSTYALYSKDKPTHYVVPDTSVKGK